MDRNRAIVQPVPTRSGGANKQKGSRSREASTRGPAPPRRRRARALMEQVVHRVAVQAHFGDRTSARLVARLPRQRQMRLGVLQRVGELHQGGGHRDAREALRVKRAKGGGCQQGFWSMNTAFWSDRAGRAIARERVARQALPSSSGVARSAKRGEKAREQRVEGVRPCRRARGQGRAGCGTAPSQASHREGP